MEIQSLLLARYFLIIPPLLTTNSGTVRKTFAWTVERMGDKQPERWAKLGEEIFYPGWFQKQEHGEA